MRRTLTWSGLPVSGSYWADPAAGPLGTSWEPLSGLRSVYTLMRSPITRKGRFIFDDLEPAEAVARSWADPGPHPDWHRQVQDVIYRLSPVLAHNLERLALEYVSRPR